MISHQSQMPSPNNPRKWRFTWEALAHIPTLRLFLFNTEIYPFNQCKNLKSSLNFEQSTLLLSWIEESGDENDEFQIRVPVPRVLINFGSPVVCGAMEDHIEIKLVLLLPVDHPLSVLDLESEGSDREEAGFSLSVHSDLKNLSSGGGVHLYCRSCSTKLTKNPLRSFVEMPSVNWREAADNWFGACCCSFGGVSEKLASEYANSYICEEGICLLDGTSIVICKDDLLGYVFPVSSNGNTKCNVDLDFVGKDNLTEDGGYFETQGRGATCYETGISTISDMCEIFDILSLSKEGTIADGKSKEVNETQNRTDTSCCMSIPMPNDPLEHSSTHSCEPQDAMFSVSPDHASLKDQDHCCSSERNYVGNQRSSCDILVPFSKTQHSAKTAELQANQKWVHNGSLGSGFVVGISNLTNDIEWVDFACSQCSSLLGSYPCVNNGHVPVDGGVRLFKFYISTSVPVGGSSDIFRKHTLQRVFVNQLMESAIDELSFRTVVRDLRTKSLMLQLVLLNSKAWCCTGYVLDTESGTTGSISKMDLQPVVKVLFSDCSIYSEAESRKLEEWSAKNQASEVYMIAHPIKELTRSLKLAKERLPFSCSFLQEFSVSYMER